MHFFLCGNFPATHRPSLLLDCFWSPWELVMIARFYFVQERTFWTGGIKPCVSSFGGDQFGPGQVWTDWVVCNPKTGEASDDILFALLLHDQLVAATRFFFFLTIPLCFSGSVISTFVVPMFRRDVKCFGGSYPPHHRVNRIACFFFPPSLTNPPPRIFDIFASLQLEKHNLCYFYWDLLLLA